MWLDEGLSGTTLDRPGLHRWRELVRAQANAAVIVIDPDRLSRHVGHPRLRAEALEPAGVQWWIVSHPLERGPEGWLCVHMRGARAEDARATRLARTQRGRMGRAQAGQGQSTQAQASFTAAAQGWCLGDATSSEMVALQRQYHA